MRRIRAITPFWIWGVAACGGADDTPRPSDEAGTPVPAEAVDKTIITDGATTADCDGAPAGGPDTGSVLTRNESRTWARPDQPSRTPCPPRPVMSSSDTIEQEPAVAVASAVSNTSESSPSESLLPPSAAPTSEFPGSSVPLMSGLVLLSVYRFPEGDRENVVRVTDVSPEGVTYQWQFIQHPKSGDPFEDSWERFVRAADLASAPRLNTYFVGRGRSDTPGYTTFTISRATYAQLRADGQAPYRTVSIMGGPFQGVLSEITKGGPLEGGLADAFRTRVTVKGTLSVVSPTPEPMPVLLNGRRVSVAALRLKGRFTYQEAQREDDFWVLADSSHPLLLRVLTGADTFQVVSIKVPEASADKEVERQLETACRVELPGVYFGFASAEMQSASIPALATVAGLLQRHPDWSFTIEGHTDSIGDPASNQTLSQRRAEAVKAKLAKLHRISPDRLQPVGFGASRPREPNSTIEGRARNRRVELVRAC
jgi:outer membrane protein OmpA-like peptidoglycan-associated protein